MGRKETDDVSKIRHSWVVSSRLDFSGKLSAKSSYSIRMECKGNIIITQFSIKTTHISNERREKCPSVMEFPFLHSEWFNGKEKGGKFFFSQVLSRELNIFRGRLNCKHSTIIEIESTSLGVPSYFVPYRSASISMFRGRKIIQTFNQPISTE